MFDTPLFIAFMKLHTFIDLFLLLGVSIYLMIKFINKIYQVNKSYRKGVIV